MTATSATPLPPPGDALYAEHTGRFVRLIDDQPEKALAEYGFTFIHSVDESDCAIFLKSLGLAEDTWRQRFLEAVALHRRGRLDEAEKRYKALLADDKGRKEVEYNLAALFLQRGDLETARKHLAAFEKYIAELDGGGATALFAAECRQRIMELREELQEA